MTVWMYYETDGDAGYYSIKLFSSKDKAIEYFKFKHDAYANIGEIKIDDWEAKVDKSLENLTCPDCDGPMVPRSSQHGKFWGCKAYPKCKGTRDVNGESKQDREKRKKSERSEDYEDIGPDPFRESNGVMTNFKKS